MDRRALALLLVFATACRAVVGIQDLTIEDAGSDAIADQTVNDAPPGESAGPTDTSTADTTDATSPIDATDATDATSPTDAAEAASDASDAGTEGDASTADTGAPLDSSNGGDGGGEGGSVAPSCAPGGAGMSNCGVTGSESCCTSLAVAGGTYARTYTNTGSGPTGTADPAMITGFRLDKYEVTVGRFRQFVAAYQAGTWTSTVTAGSGKHTHLCGGQGLVSAGATACQVGAVYEPGWVTTDNGNVGPTNGNLACDPSFATWTPSPGANENRPIGCANWWESYAFCIWDGGFLPSEAEWEYAAAGGSQELEYPWGSTTPGTPCPGTGCSFAIYGCNYPSGSGTCGSVSNMAPVGTAPAGAGLFGQLDLAGNVWEWSLDWLNFTYINPCTDCAYLTAGSGSRVFRGADFTNDAGYLLPPDRAHNNGGIGAGPSLRGYAVGLRCARAP